MYIGGTAPREVYPGASSSCISSKSGFLCIEGWHHGRVVGVCWQSEQLLNTEVGKGLGVWCTLVTEEGIFWYVGDGVVVVR